MLVITRRHDEELLIGGEVRVRVLSIKGNRVQLGVDAPAHIRVHRPENGLPVAGRMVEVARRDRAYAHLPR